MNISSEATSTFDPTTALGAADVVGIEDQNALLESGLDLFGSDILSQSNATSQQHDSAILQTTFQVYGTALVVILVFFCWARRQFPLAFCPRRAHKIQYQRQQQQRRRQKTRVDTIIASYPMFPKIFTVLWPMIRTVS